MRCTEPERGGGEWLALASSRRSAAFAVVVGWRRASADAGMLLLCQPVMAGSRRSALVSAATVCAVVLVLNSQLTIVFTQFVVKCKYELPGYTRQCLYNYLVTWYYFTLGPNSVSCITSVDYDAI